MLHCIQHPGLLTSCFSKVNRWGKVHTYVSEWFLNEGRITVSNVITIISQGQNSSTVFSRGDDYPPLPMACTPSPSEGNPSNVQYMVTGVCTCMHE